jgi:hypothetical protein
VFSTWFVPRGLELSQLKVRLFWQDLVLVAGVLSWESCGEKKTRRLVWNDHKEGMRLEGRSCSERTCTFLNLPVANKRFHTENTFQCHFKLYEANNEQNKFQRGQWFEPSSCLSGLFPVHKNELHSNICRKKKEHKIYPFHNSVLISRKDYWMLSNDSAQHWWDSGIVLICEIVKHKHAHLVVPSFKKTAHKLVLIFL